MSFGTPNVPTLRSVHAVCAIAIGEGSAGPVGSAVAMAGCAEIALRFVPLASALYIHVAGKNVGIENAVCASVAFVALDGL